MPYASSAGRHGKTCRQYVLCGVDVPIMPGAAVGARRVPRAQAKVFEQVPARRACLGRRVPPLDHDKVTAIPLALVLKLTAQFSPTAVRDRAGQPTAPDHTGYAQVLDDDDVRRADQADADTVQEVPAGIADLAVATGG